MRIVYVYDDTLYICEIEQRIRENADKTHSVVVSLGKDKTQFGRGSERFSSDEVRRWREYTTISDRLWGHSYVVHTRDDEY